MLWVEVFVGKSGMTHRIYIENQGVEGPTGDYFTYVHTFYEGHDGSKNYSESTSYSIRDFDRSRGALALLYEALKQIYGSRELPPALSDPKTLPTLPSPRDHTGALAAFTGLVLGAIAALVIRLATM